MKLTDFKVLTFDCYGTLIDWESGILSGLRPLRAKLSSPLSDDEILNAHARAESSQQIYTPAMPYRRLLAVVYKRLAEQWHISASWQEALTYGEGIAAWRAFPDSREALLYLKQHYRLVILSNVDNESFAASNRYLGIEFDGIFTAEDIGSYKPSSRNFSYLIEKLADWGFAKKDILHTAESLFHDHQPAKMAGLATAWIHRRHAKKGFGATMDPGKIPPTDFKFDSMAEMAEAHKRCLRA